MDTSLEALASIRPVIKSIRERVFDLINRHNGLTCYELVRGFGFRHQTVTARINELAKAGRIQDSGRRGLTQSGREAIVWEAVGP